MKAYDDVYKTPGAISWTELMTPDPAAAAEFYGSLFGWTVEKSADVGMDYRVIKVGETSQGGMMAPPPGGPPMPPHWNAYVTVADLQHTLATCERLGGKVLMPGMDIPQVGRLAVIQDPQGAVINVIQYHSAET
jgi:predicted enzyme related to lactoylglutathione lyase